MRGLKISLILVVCAALAGCGGLKMNLSMRGLGDIEFPNGTVLGGASSDQAGALADIFVKSHNLHMQAFSEQKELSEKNLQTAEKALQLLEQISQSQGTGEITLFFNTGQSRISRNSLEYERLVRFVDYVARESSGRLVHFVLIGSSSSFGSKSVNQRLSTKRSEAPVDIIEKYLVNVPHQFHKVGGTGEMYSPQKASGKVHRRYQHVRVIASYATDTLPELPPETM